MNFSRTAEYALRAVIWLAQHRTGAAGTAQIAQAVQVPTGYLSKVLQTLARAGLVASAPGRTGGFWLDRDPERLSVLDVINAVDPFQRIEHCPLRLKSHQTALCPLHRRLDDALGSVQHALEATTIASLLSQSDAVSPLCEPER